MNLCNIGVIVALLFKNRFQIEFYDEILVFIFGLEFSAALSLIITWTSKEAFKKQLE